MRFVSLKTLALRSKGLRASPNLTTYSQHASQRLNCCIANLGVASRALSANCFHDIKFNCLSFSTFHESLVLFKKKKLFFRLKT